MNLFLQSMDFPLTIVLVFLAAAVIISWAKMEKSRYFITASLVLALLFSGQTLFKFFDKKYIKHYPSIITVSEELKRVPYVVVLGGEAYPEGSWPVTSQLTSSLARLIEGIRLHKQIFSSKLVLSGGSRYKKSDAELMKELAVSLGVNQGDIILETKSKNTFEEAYSLKWMLGAKPFILVTSDRHMQRAVAIFQKAGMSPIPAPTAHSTAMTKLGKFKWLPKSGNIGLYSEIFYEFLSSIKAKFLGRI